MHAGECRPHHRRRHCPCPHHPPLYCPAEMLCEGGHTWWATHAHGKKRSGTTKVGEGRQGDLTKQEGEVGGDTETSTEVQEREREDSPTCAHHCVPDSPPSTDVRWSRVVTTTVLSAFVRLGTWPVTHGEWRRAHGRQRQQTKCASEEGAQCHFRGNPGRYLDEGQLATGQLSQLLVHALGLGGAEANTAPHGIPARHHGA